MICDLGLTVCVCVLVFEREMVGGNWSAEGTSKRGLRMETAEGKAILVVLR